MELIFVGLLLTSYQKRNYVRNEIACSFVFFPEKSNIESINVLQSAFSECDTVNTRQTHSRNAKIIINGRTQLNS